MKVKSASEPRTHISCYPDPQVGESFVGPRTFHFHALEKEMATHFSVLAWRIPWMEEPGGLQKKKKKTDSLSYTAETNTTL